MEYREAIALFSPQTAAEQEAKQAALALIAAEGDRSLTRESARLHFTAAGLVLNPQMDQTLMVFHNIFKSYTFPGGHADGEKDLLLTALKETREETGVCEVYPIEAGMLSLDLLQVKAHRRRGKKVAAHGHLAAVFGLIAPEAQALTVKPDENTEVRWIPLSQLDALCTEPDMLPIYHKVIDRMQTAKRQKEATFAKLPSPLVAWYRENARVLPWRKDKAPYHVWLSEIMLQQTRVEAVRSYYLRFLKALPTVAALARVPEERLMKLWEGLGYYSRARNLKKAAVAVMERHGGQFPNTFEEISALPGIGPYTAGAIASICFEQPVPAVDGNVLRVIARVTEDFQATDRPAMKTRTAQGLKAVYPKGACGDFTQSLMELGATVCLPSGAPRCGVCPLAGFCLANRHNTQTLLPVREAKKKRKIERLTVLLLQSGDAIAVRKREENGLLAGLWELPNLAGELSPQQAADAATKLGANPVALLKTVKRKHIFTHIEWEMTGYLFACDAPAEQSDVSQQDPAKRVFETPAEANAAAAKAPKANAAEKAGAAYPGGLVWAPPEMRRQEISLPTAFKQFLPDFSV